MSYYLLNDIDGLKIAVSFIMVIITSFLFGYMVGKNSSNHGDKNIKAEFNKEESY